MLEEKRLIKRTYEKWRRGKERKSRYIEERKDWRGIFKKKERRYKEKEEAQLRSLKNENDMWQFLKRFRKRKESELDDISLDDWKQHFKHLLYGEETRKTGEQRTKEEDEIRIEGEEIDAV